MAGRLVQGFTRSLWTSVAVKSLHLGWPAGLEEARRHLSPSSFKATLLCGVFEDVFPAVDELEDAVDEILRGDIEALCRRDTHHGRGLTVAFCALEREAVHEAATAPHEIRERMSEAGLVPFLPPRALNCAYTWLTLAPTDQALRELDQTPWSGMPSFAADAHTDEGRARRTFTTLLSGTYSQHRRIASMVMEEGWSALRQRVHERGTIEPSTPLLLKPWTLA